MGTSRRSAVKSAASAGSPRPPTASQRPSLESHGVDDPVQAPGLRQPQAGRCIEPEGTVARFAPPDPYDLVPAGDEERIVVGAKHQLGDVAGRSARFQQELGRSGPHRAAGKPQQKQPDREMAPGAVGVHHVRTMVVQGVDLR
jgi:hypothetical protein